MPLARIELATSALQVQRSTTKLKRQLYLILFMVVGIVRSSRDGFFNFINILTTTGYFILIFGW